MMEISGISGKLCVKLNDEQLDQVVIDHLHTVVVTVETAIALDRAAYRRSETSQERDMYAYNVMESRATLEALLKVITYLGGDTSKYYVEA